MYAIDNNSNSLNIYTASIKNLIHVFHRILNDSLNLTFFLVVIAYFRHLFDLQKEEALPSLPVPDLETTLQKYLAQVEVITPNHLERTRSLVKAFLSGPGPKLQQRLLERRQKTTNWVSNYIFLYK